MSTGARARNAKYHPKLAIINVLPGRLKDFTEPIISVPIKAPAYMANISLPNPVASVLSTLFAITGISPYITGKTKILYKVARMKSMNRGLLDRKSVV